MTALKWLAVLASVGCLAGLVGLFFAQRSFIFPIPQTVRTAPEAAGFGVAEEHLLTTADGEKIIVWHVPAKSGHAVVIYFHGNGDFLAGLVGRFRDITADGTGLVALSYRGYAGSSGWPSEHGLLWDAAAAYAFASARYGAADRRIGKLILEAPYTSITEVAGAAFPVVPVRWLIRDQFRSDQRIARVTAPLLVMHGARDSIISIKLGERLFALAHEPKQFVRFPEGGHNDLDNHGAIETARHFISNS